MPKTEKKYCAKNHKTNRCKTSKVQDKPSYCYMDKNTNRCKQIDKELLENEMFGEYKLTKKAYNYLDKLILKKTPAKIKKMRKMQQDKELYIPLNEYTNDNDLKEYLFNEVCDLATNYVRDKNWYLRDTDKYEIITLKSVKTAIKEDEELDILLK
jgi:hypothetical protein